MAWKCIGQNYGNVVGRLEFEDVVNNKIVIFKGFNGIFIHPGMLSLRSDKGTFLYL